MKKVAYSILTMFSLVFAATFAVAQTPTDAILMGKGDICWAAIYTHDSWDEYWEGTLKRDNGNIGTMNRNSIMPMFAFGITDNLNLIASLPWVQTEATQGQLKGVSGLQDLGVFLKLKAVDASAGPGRFTAFPSVGFTLPTSNYLEDYAPFSIGLGCPDLMLRGIVQYRLDMGMFLRLTGAYQVRGTGKIERDFYYTTHGVYSDKIDMPNALNYGASLGIWTLGNSLKVEATFEGLHTYGGFDIRRQDVGFPSNRMEFTRAGGGFQYFLPFANSFSVVGSYSQVLTGRNVGQSTTISAGLTYQFTLIKPKSNEAIMN